MKITCNYDRCTGNGLCEAAAPEYFEVQDNGDLEILRADIDPADLELLEQAVDSCPTQALSLVK